MPVTKQIRDDGRIFFVRTSDPYTTAEFKPIQQQELDHRNQFQKDHPGEKVHLVIDMSQAKSAAANFMRARETPGLSHPTAGYVVIIGANPLIRRLSEAVLSLRRFRQVYFADNEQAAMDFLGRAPKL